MQRKPTWWLLYAIFPLSAGLFWLDGRLTLQPQGHQLLQMGIVLLSFGLMALWLRANQVAVAGESATHGMYLPLPDPECNQPLELPTVADWHNGLYAHNAKQAPMDLTDR